MSKNELVSYIHALTGKTFKESRAICKAAKWDTQTAFMIATIGNANFDRICKLIYDTSNALVSCLTPAVNCACETMREFAQALAQGIKDGLDNPPSGAIMQAIRNEIDEGGADNAGT